MNTDGSKILSDTENTSKYDFIVFSDKPYLHSQTEKSICNYIKNQGHRIYYFYNGNAEEKFTIVDKNLLCISTKLFFTCENTSLVNKTLCSFIKSENIRCAVMYIFHDDFKKYSSYLLNTYGFLEIDALPYDTPVTNVYNYINSSFPLSSIIILTYNNLKYTKDCIDSIMNYTQYPNYEIIIIDNNSKDSTPQYLIELKNNNNKVKIFLNRENAGFAKGNNIGIKMSSGEYIVLLNNDTVVTKGWLSNLVKYYTKYGNSYGIIGPVTNCICTKAKIPTTYTDMNQMHMFAENYVFNNLNRINNRVAMVAMFCTIISREVLNKVGLLDENFVIGNFEDDDYCHRAKLLGYNIAIVYDVFIHHKGSASMDTLEKSELRNIWTQNKKYFEKKWSKRWRPN